MRYLGLYAVLFVCLPGFGGAATPLQKINLAPASAPPAKLYRALSMEELAQTLLLEGLRFEHQTIDGKGIVANERLNVYDGVRWSAFGYDCDDESECTEFQMRAIFQAAGVEATILPRLNTWNATNRFTRAYLAATGHNVILEMDVYLNGGQSLQNISEQVAIWRQSVRRFSSTLSVPAQDQ